MTSPHYHAPTILRRLVRLSGYTLLAASPLWAQQAPSADAPDPQVLRQYDKNHNGQLEPDEQAAYQADQARARANPTASTPSTRGPGTNDDVLEMTPFTVSTEKDRGYYASNAMSGTRINAKVEDLASAITVVTKQQLLDTAALDINDVFLYEGGVEGTGTYTAFSVDRNGSVNDAGQGSPQTANRARGIGSVNIARDGYRASSRIPIDVYNIDSIEISRGPNSTLFGLGAASGTTNTNLAHALLTKEATSVSAQFDSYGGYRAAVDVNRPIFRDRLAIRVNALYDSRGFTQKPSYDLSRRGQIALTAKPFKNTTIRAIYESYHEQRQLPNALTPRDSVSEWIADGQPTWDPVTSTATVNGVKTRVPIGTATVESANLPAGLLGDNTFNTRPSMFIEPDGKVAFWTVNRTSLTANPNTPNGEQRYLYSSTNLLRNRANAFPLFTSPGVSNKSIYDWSSINIVSTNWEKDRADLSTIEVEQKLADNLFFKAGFHLEDSAFHNHNISNPPTLYVDPNERLLDGSPNPYFKRTYIAVTEPSITWLPEKNENEQVQLTYELDLTKHTNWTSWLGHYRTLVYWDRQVVDTQTRRFREAVYDPNPNLLWVSRNNYAAGNAAGRTTYRYMVGDATGYNVDYGPAKSGVSGTYNLNYYNGVTKQWTSDQALYGEIPYQANKTRTNDAATGAVMQAFLLKDYLVFTGGIRRDIYKSRNSLATSVDPTTGYYTYTNLNVYAPWAYAKGNTTTYNVVVKPFGPTSWINFFVGGANSFQPQPAAYNLLGQQLPNPSGKDLEIGVHVSTRDQKLSARIGFYDTKSINNRTIDSGIAGRVTTLETGTNSGNFQSLINWARAIVVTRDPSLVTPQQIDAAANQIARIPGTTPVFNDGRSVGETGDVQARGIDLEVNYNPIRGWTNKFTGGHQRTINTNLGPAIQQYIAQRLTYWQSVSDPAGNSWWTTAGGQAYYNTNINAPLQLALANQGKQVTQNTEYSWRYLTKYTFQQERLKGLSIGGAARWDGRKVLGYFGADTPAGQPILTLNGDKPVYQPSQYYFDFLTSYRFRTYNNRVGTTLQLNLRNAFESGGLQVVGVNPDGTGYNFRIIQPRQLILSANFEF